MPMFWSSAKKPDSDLLNSHSLFWLTCALCLSLLPHIARIPIWLSLIATASILYMLSSLYWNLARPKIWVLWLLVSICVIAVAAHYGRLFSRDAGVSLLVLMLSLKLLETRRHRDGMVMSGLLYFSVITHFLYDQSIPLAFFMLLAVAINTFALITLNESTARIAIPQKIRMVGALLLSALPIMTVLFLLFPRIPGPLWSLSQDVYSAHSGMSDSMSPGDFSQLALSDEPAFRVVFSGQSPRPEHLYWRTLILGNFDGRTWHIDEKAQMVEPERLLVAGEPLQYTVTMEPHQRRWLFALDMPVSGKSATLLNGEKLNLTSERLLRTVKPVVNLAQYRAVSHPQYRLSPQLNKYQRERTLQIPAYFNPRSIELAKSWRTQTQQPLELIEYALDLFRQDFTYTLKPPVLGLHSIDEFLFVSKRGFCEHFAGSFVFLMRAAGVPARVVTGYQGGQFNPLDDYLLVRQSDAHAWAEVWVEDRGWIRVDPTTAVSPARIELGLDEAIPLNERTDFFFSSNFPLINNLSLLRDAIDNRWNLWILGYGPELQMGFLSKLGFRNPDAYTMTFTMVLGIAILLIITGLLSLKRRMPRSDDAVQRIYVSLCAHLSKMGYARLAYEGPADFAARIKKQNPALGTLMEPVLNLYGKLRYGRQHIPHPARVLRRRVLAIRHMLKKPQYSIQK
jgi:protein-glutamine gamma-glutamyltransferase